MTSTNDSIVAAVAARDAANERAATAYYVLRSYIAHVVSETGQAHEEVPNLYPGAAQFLADAVADVLGGDD